MSGKTYYGKNFQAELDRSSGKSLEYLQAGLRNATVRCSTEVFVAGELILAGSTIMIAKLTNGIVPSFTVLEATKELVGSIGTTGRPNLFGSFTVKGDIPAVVMPAEANTPLKTGGDIFIKTVNDFPAGGRISIKLFHTRD